MPPEEPVEENKGHHDTKYCRFSNDKSWTARHGNVIRAFIGRSLDQKPNHCKVEEPEGDGSEGCSKSNQSEVVECAHNQFLESRVG